MLAIQYHKHVKMCDIDFLNAKQGNKGKITKQSYAT